MVDVRKMKINFLYIILFMLLFYNPSFFNQFTHVKKLLLVNYRIKACLLNKVQKFVIKNSPIIANKSEW